MGGIFETFTKLRRKMALYRVRAVPNPNYQRDGTKSYVSALSRFGFQPTRPGPYFQIFKESEQSPSMPAASGVKPGHIWQGIFKRIKGKEEPEEVTAEDQQRDCEFLCEIMIGTAWTAERQILKVDFDTGSGDFWVCQERFDPKKSVTWKPAEDMSWKVKYGDGNSVSGIVGHDILIIGGIQIKSQAVEVATEMPAQLAEGSMDGVLGLAFSKLNSIQTGGKPDPQPTVVDNMTAQEDIPPEAEVFTAALYSSWEEDRRSFYTFGWIDEELVKASGKEIAWADIDSSEGFWMFSSEHANVDGHQLRIEGNKAIADTGTSLVLVSDQVCDALYARIPGAKYSEEYQGWTFPQETQVGILPEFSIAIGGKEFVFQKENLIFTPADKSVFYGSVQSRGENSFDILGTAFLKSIYAIWDRGQKRFGAVPKIETFVPPAKFDRPRLTNKDRKDLGVTIGYGDISSTFFEKRE